MVLYFKFMCPDFQCDQLRHGKATRDKISVCLFCLVGTFDCSSLKYFNTVEPTEIVCRKSKDDHLQPNHSTRELLRLSTSANSKIAPRESSNTHEVIENDNVAF